jgi:CBS domain-containing protein
MLIREILRAKGSEVFSIAPDATIPDAMRKLVHHNIGALVVLSMAAIHGIITERDLLRAGARSPGLLTDGRVRDLMTADVVTGSPGDDIRSVMKTMTERRIRHLPIVDGTQLCGMVSIGDVVNALRRDIENENQQLHAYITGVQP